MVSNVSGDQYLYIIIIISTRRFHVLRTIPSWKNLKIFIDHKLQNGEGILKNSQI